MIIVRSIGKVMLRRQRKRTANNDSVRVCVARPTHFTDYARPVQTACTGGGIISSTRGLQLPVHADEAILRRTASHSQARGPKQVPSRLLSSHSCAEGFKNSGSRTRKDCILSQDAVNSNSHRPSQLSRKLLLRAVILMVVVCGPTEC